MIRHKCVHCIVKAPVLQILLENHDLCKYAKISLHIHIIVDLNKNIGLNPHMFTVLLRKQTIRVSAIGIYLLKKDITVFLYPGYSKYHVM